MDHYPINVIMKQIQRTGAKLLLARMDRTVSCLWASEAFLEFFQRTAPDIKGMDPVDLLTSNITSDAHVSEICSFFSSATGTPVGKGGFVKNVLNYRPVQRKNRTEHQAFSCTVTVELKHGIFYATLSNEKNLSKDDERREASKTVDCVCYPRPSPPKKSLVPVSPKIPYFATVGCSRKQWFNFRPEDCKSKTPSPADIEDGTSTLDRMNFSSPPHRQLFRSKQNREQSKWGRSFTSTSPHSWRGPSASSVTKSGSARSVTNSLSVRSLTNSRSSRAVTNSGSAHSTTDSRSARSATTSWTTWSLTNSGLRHSKMGLGKPHGNLTAEKLAVMDLDLFDHGQVQMRLHERSFWKKQAPLTAAASAAAAVAAIEVVSIVLPAVLAKASDVENCCTNIRQCSQKSSIIAQKASDYAAATASRAERKVKKTLARVLAQTRASHAAQLAAAVVERSTRRMCAYLAAVEGHWYKWCLQQVIVERIGNSCPDVYVDVLHGKINLLVTAASNGVINYKPGTAIILESDLPLVDQVGHSVFTLYTVLQEYGRPMLDVSIEGHIHADPGKIASAMKKAGVKAEQHAAAKKLQATIRGRQQRISIERAHAVADAIEQKGVPKGHLISVGYGGQRPIGTPEQNRRVEITMRKVQGKKRNGAKSPDDSVDVPVEKIAIGPQTDLGKLFLASDTSQRAWKIGRGPMKFAKEAKIFMIQQLSEEKLLRPL